MRAQVEALEHHPDPAPDRVGVEARFADVDAVEPDLTVVDRLEHVDAAQQGALARTGRTNQADHLRLRDVEADLIEHRVGAESFDDCVDSQFHWGRIHLTLVPDISRRSRWIRWSVSRVSGTETHRNNTAAATYGV